MSISVLTFYEARKISGASDGGEANGGMSDALLSCGTCAAGIIALCGTEGVFAVTGGALATSFACGECVNDVINLSDGLFLGDNSYNDTYLESYEMDFWGD